MMHATTILAVRHKDQVVIGGDDKVSNESESSFSVYNESASANSKDNGSDSELEDLH